MRTKGEYDTLSLVYKFANNGPFTKEDLAELRQRWAEMSDTVLREFYDAAWKLCRLERETLPRASYVQQLVQAWRELIKRR